MDGWSFVALALAALAGLALSLAERAAARADNDWRRRNHLNGVGKLVADNAVEQETARSTRMGLYLLLATLVMTDVLPAQQRAFITILVVLLDAWTAARKARLRRAIRRLELEQLGDVVVLDAADAGH
jgi:hypothetical protein